LREGVGLAELVAATFPGGSITGAPKIAAVDLIAGIEPVGRGASMGALGTIRGNGDLDLALTIRTFAIADGRIHLWVGGGIVWATQQTTPEPAATSTDQLDTMKALVAEKDALIATLTEKYNAVVASSTVVPTATAEVPPASRTTKQFTFVKNVTVSGGKTQVVADYAQFLTGTAAAASAAAHGDESPPPNDYYIANDNKKLRTLPVKSGIKVTLTALDDGTSDPEGYKVSLAKWAGYYAAPTADTGSITGGPYWFTITDGVVTAIEEQYTP